MNVPKTPTEFDYDLWTTEDGKCMVRLKRTGEISEVEREVFRLLRLEEKRMRREIQGTPIPGGENNARVSVLSLDYVPASCSDSMELGWTEDLDSLEDNIIFCTMEAEFQKILSPVQFEVYTICIKGGFCFKEYAHWRSISPASVSDTLKSIRKKAQKFFREAP